METIVRASIKVNERGEVCFISAQNPMKRYFYNSSLVEENDERRLLVMMYNPSTEDADDPTARYIGRVCECSGYTAFAIVNLIPEVGGDPSEIDVTFDIGNFTIVKRILDATKSKIWVGWGRTLVKWKVEKILFPNDMKCLLRTHAARLIQATAPSKGVYSGKHPVHPKYLQLYKNVQPEEVIFVPYNIKLLGWS